MFGISVTELVDCDKSNGGCLGGWPHLAFESIMKLGGLETEQDYPYQGSDMQCRFDKGKIKATISGYVNISSDEQEMAQWLSENAPMTIAINAIPLQVSYIH